MGWLIRLRAKLARRRLERTERFHKRMFGYANKVLGWKRQDATEYQRILDSMSKEDFALHLKSEGYPWWLSKPTFRRVEFR